MSDYLFFLLTGSGRGNACGGETSNPTNIFSAVNNFFADSPLVNQLKVIMVSYCLAAQNSWIVCTKFLPLGIKKQLLFWGLLILFRRFENCIAFS